MASDRDMPVASRVRSACSAASSSLTEIARAMGPAYHLSRYSRAGSRAGGSCGRSWFPPAPRSRSAGTASGPNGEGDLPTTGHGAGDYPSIRRWRPGPFKRIRRLLPRPGRRRTSHTRRTIEIDNLAFYETEERHFHGDSSTVLRSCRSSSSTTPAGSGTSTSSCRRRPDGRLTMPEVRSRRANVRRPRRCRHGRRRSRSPLPSGAAWGYR